MEKVTRQEVLENMQDIEDEIYFISARTVPGNLRTFCQFRGRAMFVEVYKGNKRYDLMLQNCPDNLIKHINDACVKAISNWEMESDIFIEEENAFEQDSIKTSKKIIDLRTIICFILAILLLLSLLIR